MLYHLAILFVSAYGSLSWKPISSKYYRGGAFQVSESSFEVPLDYGGQSKMSLYARRFQRGSPKRVMLLIPGGPGQSGRVYDGEVRQFESFNDLWIYSLDHRGTGKSGKLARGKDDRCLWNPQSCADVEVLKHYTAANATKDLVAWVDRLKQEHPEAQMYAVASSYGTQLIYRVLFERPNLFESVLMIDFFPSFKMRNADLTESILKLCHKDISCREKWPSAERVHAVMQEVSQPQRNECTKHLRGLETLKAFGTKDNLAPLIHLMMHNTLVSLPVTMPKHSIVVAMSFLEQLHQCTDLPAFKQMTDDLLNAFFQKGKLIRRSHVLERSGKGHLNPLLNGFIGYSEIHQQDLSSCQEQSKQYPFSECSMLNSFKKGYGKSFHSIAYAPQHFDIAPLTTSTRVTVVGGGLDPQTPIQTARQAFEQINASKSFYQLDHGVHGSANICAPSLYSSLFDAYYSPASCFMSYNGINIDWKYNSKYYEAAPRSKWPLILLSILILLIVGAGVYFYLRRK